MTSTHRPPTRPPSRSVRTPNPPTDHAHARAHAEAAGVLALTWQIAPTAHPRTRLRSPPTAASPQGGRAAAQEDAIRRHLAITTWKALDPAAKTQVAATVLARIGTLPTPTPAPDAIPHQVSGKRRLPSPRKDSMRP